jgi:hypothetical protein
MFCLQCVVGLDHAPHVDFVDQENAYMYGYFSPRAAICMLSLPAASMSKAIKIVALVLQVMHELQELSGESSVDLPMELDAFEALAVATTTSPPPLSEPCQVTAYVDSGGFDAYVILSSMTSPTPL